MKPYSYISLVLFSISNCIFAQSNISSQKDSLGTTITLQQNLNTVDSIAFKRFCDSIRYRNNKPFSKGMTFTTINKKVFENLKFSPLPKQQVYFSIHDYTAGSHLSPVSQYENPYFDNVKNLRFLWSGHVMPYREIGAPENYLRTNQ